MGEGRGGKRQRRHQERVDRADRNWLRSQSCRLLTMNSVASLSPPLCPRHNLTCSFEPSYPCYPHSPSRSPGPPPVASKCYSDPLYSSFTEVSLAFMHATNPYFSPNFPLPLESLTHTFSSHFIHKPSPNIPSPNTIQQNSHIL